MFVKHDVDPLFLYIKLGGHLKNLTLPEVRFGNGLTEEE